MQSLFTTLKEQLQLSDKKITFFVRFIESIIEKKTINLDEIAEVINPNNTKKSNYRILKRFFKDFNLCFTALAKIINNYIIENFITFFLTCLNLTFKSPCTKQTLLLAFNNIFN